MSAPRPLSDATRELLRAAKGDGPNTATRAKIWSEVGSAIGAPVASGSSPSMTPSPGPLSTSPAAAAAVGATGGAKMLALGTLFGSAITVGVAVVLLRVGPASPPPPPPAATIAPIAAAPALADLPSNAAPAPLSAPAPVPAPAPAPASAPAHAHTRTKPSHEDALSREASLVVQARAALEDGDPRAAIRASRAARALPSRQLLPEELAVEAKAYHALGQENDAREAEAALKVLFPEAALSQ